MHTCGLLLLMLFSCFSWVRVLRTVQTGLGGRIAKSWKGQTESYDRQVLVCVCVRTHAFVQVGFWECLERACYSVQSSIADREQCAVFAEWPDFGKVPAGLWPAWP